MCGIAGLYCQNPKCPGDGHAPLVARMCEIQTHRGPDDSGLVQLGRACLGTRRLSIIDLSPAGHMPMSDPTGRWWITYNGEVYNFGDLREELESLGHRFRSRTDTEVVLHAFIEWDERCIERFIGMFAFGIYDCERNRLFLARDRFGIKPLYYLSRDKHLIFGSEIKALLAAGERGILDRSRLMEWFLYRNVDSLSPETLFDGVTSVLPGRVVTVSPAGISTTEVYRLLEQVTQEEFQRFTAMRKTEVVDEMDATLCDATRLRLVSDVPVGTLLSGGLDSSLITAIAAAHSQRFKAFHVSIAGYANLDERRFAEDLAHRLQLDLVTFDLTGEIFRRELPRAVYLSDLPVSHPNSVAYHLISRVARDHGVIVLLSGEGADELFGGYAWRYRRRWYLHRIAPLLRALPDRLWSWLALLTYANTGMPFHSRAFRDLLPPMVSFVDRYERSAWQSKCEDVYAFVPRGADREVLGATLADLHVFLSPLLRRLDRMSMGASVECRVPYLDHRLVHKVINLPLSYRIGSRSDKWILKQVAARHIPQHLARRKKAGFPLPLYNYIAPLAHPEFFAGGFCQNELGMNAQGFAHFLESSRRWTLGFFGFLTLEIWGRLFIRGEALEDVQERVQRFEPRRNAEG